MLGNHFVQLVVPFLLFAPQPVASVAALLIIAAVLLSMVSSALQPFPELRMLIYGVVLVVIMVFRPSGLLGDRELSFRALSRLVPRRQKEVSS